jgi:hypothetical protein
VDPKEILLSAIKQRPDAIWPYTFSCLDEAFPNGRVLQTETRSFRPWQDDAPWTVRPHEEEGLLGITDVQWHIKKGAVQHKPSCGWFKVQWNEKKLDIFLISVYRSHCSESAWFVVGPDRKATHDFFAEVCRFTSTTKGNVLVYQDAYWYSDKDLFESIQGTSLSDLVLHGQLREEIRNDISLFFDQEGVYRKYGIPWKRGYLFLGPPGNGKTHLLKALINHFDRPCLYVKSLHARHDSPQSCVAQAFSRARDTAPCFFLLEDLDTLLNEENRSFFLNEMDGFASNDGIVTIASCNFPDKLDSAIMDRPSRFDRKYHFELPETVDRSDYLARYMSRFEKEMQLNAQGLKEVSDATAGYSYAYLKELYVSSAVRWVSGGSARPIAEVMLEQCESLRSQMVTENDSSSNEASRR